MSPERFASMLERRGVRLSESETLDVFSRPVLDLLTPPTGNPKVEKGLKKGVSTAILHLAPSDMSGFQTCPAATAGCRASCLNTAGRGGMGLDPLGLNVIQRARRRRTYWFIARREEFMTRLVREISLHEAKARREGLVPAVRLNGTSDIPWERIPVGGRRNIMRLFPRVKFYDYTKRTDRGERETGRLPRNYHLTFSLAESNGADADVMLSRGINVAVVLRTPEISRRAGTRYARKAPLPASFQGLRVIDGDDSDLRFRDPRGVYVGLRAKGRAVSDTTGFVRDAA